MSSRNLVIAGFMGTGKSTVGPIVARTLAWSFVDTDLLVEQRSRMKIKEIFATRGESAFRTLERRAIRSAAGMEQAVISVGGGALLDPENVRTLEARGVLVLLTCERDALIRRLEDEARRGERPLLDGDLPQRIEELLRAREPVYSQVRLRVDTTHLTPEEAANSVLCLYRQAIHEEALA